MAETTKPDWRRLLDEALTAPGSLGNTYNRFTDYSYGNIILLLMQGVQEPVAGYKKWQQLGRQVLKGATGKEILHPVMIHVEDEDGEKVEHVVGFKLRRSVFPLSVTEGKDLPPAPIPGWDLGKALDKLGIKGSTV